ncbi:MAG: FAD-binding oxidoreductase [Gammaproteobacteria bacterium]|jgi:glycine/D-amino acid oxidase-like deaminating enzyme
MIRVNSKPADLGASGWVEILPPRVPREALRQDIDCDYLVVGAGFAGLAAARRIRQLDPGAQVVLLEARRVADGPAGRNSGFMIDLPHALAKGSYGGKSERDSRNIRINRAAIEFAADAVREYGLEAEAFVPRGKINAAAGRQGSEHNRAYARHLEALGEPCRLLDAREMKAVCGSDYYCGGLETPGTAIIQPALYVRSFADAIAGGPRCGLYENSAVESLERTGERWRAITSQGSVRAARVILAVNGLIETFGFYRHRLMHINLYASMTRALARAEIDTLGGVENWGFTPADPIGSTVRRIDGSRGTRLVIRNRCTYEASLRLPRDRLLGVRGDHQRTLYARFPMLEDVGMEYTWSGRLCLSRNEAWASGELAPGLFSACCQNGLGTTRGTVAGIVAAEQAHGGGEPSLVPDFPAREQPSRLFPEPFMTLGARGVIRFKEWRAGREL